MFDDVGERGRAQFDGNVEKIRLSLLIEVPDDIGMIVGLLEDTDFSGGQGDKILEKTFDGDSTALQRTLENHGSVGTETWASDQETKGGA